MNSKAKLAGHAVHPMLVVFPLGLLATSLIFDIIYMASGNGRWADTSYLLIGGGILGGLAAAVFGAVDWLAIPNGTRAKAIGLWHGLGNAIVLVLFVIGWSLRRPLPADPGTAAIVISFIGIGLAVVTGWLGGELVDRLGVGVDDGAHLDAPSSLSDRPASEIAGPESAVRPSQVGGTVSGGMPGRSTFGRGVGREVGSGGIGREREPDVRPPSGVDQPSRREVPPPPV